MGFYPPDALVHEAQRRGIAVLAPDINESDVECRMGPEAACGSGSAMSVACAARTRELSSPPARTADGSAALGISPRAQAPAPRRSNCSRGRERATRWWRRAWHSDPAPAQRTDGSPQRLTRLAAAPGVVATGRCTPGRGVPGGVQLSLALDLPAPPRLRELSAWESMLADYGTHRIDRRRASTRDCSEIACRRGASTADGARTTGARSDGSASAASSSLRQRPGTAGGVVFVLLEDERGTINLIVPPATYERYRLTRSHRAAAARRWQDRAVRGGRRGDQRAGGHRQARSLHRTASSPRSRISRCSTSRYAPGWPQEGTEDFRAVAPAVMSFGAGRRR